MFICRPDALFLQQLIWFLFFEMKTVLAAVSAEPYSPQSSELPATRLAQISWFNSIERCLFESTNSIHDIGLVLKEKMMNY